MRPDLDKTDQQIFDCVVAHLRQQGKSIDGDICVYRTIDGKSCAVGVCIPQDLYVPKMECKGIKALSLMETINLDLRLFFREHYILLSKLQIIHDAYATEKWEQEFRKVANDLGLLLDGQVVAKDEGER